MSTNLYIPKELSLEGHIRVHNLFCNSPLTLFALPFLSRSAPMLAGHFVQELGLS